MKKKVRVILIFIGITLTFFTPHNTYSKPIYDVQVMPLIINGFYVKDIEVRQCKNNQLILPIKEIAKTLEIPFSYNQTYKKIVIDDDFICSSNPKVIYARNEIIKDFYDDIFVPDDALSKILKTEINTNSSDFSVSVLTNKKLAILEGIKEETNSDKPLISAQIVKEVLPSDKMDFMMKSLGINGGLNFYNFKQGESSNSYSNNILRTRVKSRCFKGDFEVINDLTSYDSKLRFGGLQTNLKKEVKKTQMEIGNLIPMSLGDKTLAGGIVGVKTSNKKYTLYAGTTDYNTYLFKEYKTDITKKIVAGGCLEQKINDKLSLNLAAVHDNILGNASVSNYYNQILSSISPSLLGFSTYKNFNNISGDTLSLGAKYLYNDKISFEPSLGISNAFDHARNGINPNGAGLGGSFKTVFKKEKNIISNKLFYYSPDFYFSGNTGNSGGSQTMNDRVGMQNMLNHSNKFFSINTRAENYLADLENRMHSGNLTIEDYSISGDLKILKKTPINYSLMNRISRNNTGKFEALNGAVYCSRPLTERLSGNANFSFFNNNLEDLTTSSLSSTQKNTLGMNYLMPKRLGSAKLEHEVISTTSSSNANTKETSSKRIRIGYNFPRILKLTPSFNVGMPYSGNIQGLDYNVSLAYIFNSGKEIRLNYYFNRQNGYIFDNIYIPSNSRSTLAINFVDNLSLYGGMKPLTMSTDDFGFVKVCTFCDKNENGQFDKNDKLIPNVGIKIQDDYKLGKTNKKGVYTSCGLKEGNYFVSLNKNDLSSFYGTIANNENFSAKVEKDKVTSIYIPITSTPGIVFGKIKIVDELGNDVKISDLPISIYDKTGQEIDYSSVDEDMNFNISNLKAGNYTIKIAKEFEEAYSLTQLSKDLEIEIPEVFDDNFIIDNLMLNYAQKDYI